MLEKLTVARSPFLGKLTSDLVHYSPIKLIASVLAFEKVEKLNRVWRAVVTK